MSELETNIGTRDYKRPLGNRSDEFLVGRSVHAVMTQDVWEEVWDATRGFMFTPTLMIAETVDSALQQTQIH